MNPVVVYHAECFDGFTGAWVARRLFGKNVVFYPAKHAGGELPADLAEILDEGEREIYLIDFCYPGSTLDQIAEKVSKITILDHHKTAVGFMEEWDREGLPCEVEVVLDMERSGAGVAWDYFFPAENRHWLVNYVEDQDIWKWDQPDSKAINAYIGTCAKTFASWDKLASQKPEVVKLFGEAVVNYQDVYCREMTDGVAREVMWEGEKTWIINAPFFMISHLLNYIVRTKDVGMAVGWWQSGDGSFKYSLRSDGKTNVREIAEKYGGGGHDAASGFRLKHFIFGGYNGKPVEEDPQPQHHPFLGLATTGELLEELTARCEINGTIDYRTVDEDSGRALERTRDLYAEG